MVEFALGYIDGGSRAKEIVSQVDYDGAITASICIAGSFGLLAINKYREQKALKTASTKSNELEVL